MGDNTLEVTLDGYTVGGTLPSGAKVSLEDIDGWGVPAVDVGVVKRPRTNGAWVGEGVLDARYVTLRGKITAPTIAARLAAQEALFSHFTLEPTSLVVTEADNIRSLTVQRSRAEVLVRFLSGHGNNIEWSVQLIAADPRKVSTDLSGSTGLPSTSGGMTFPFEFPFTFDEVATSGRVELTNPGNAPGRVTLRILAGTGGLTGPAVTHIASGETLQFATSLTIPEGNWIDVDMDAQTVLENGQPGATRNGWVTGRGWSSFEPGANEWAFTAESGDGTLTVTATPSWW